MQGSILRGLRSRLFAAGLTILTGLAVCRPAIGYTPGSKEVRDAVARAVRFLESPPQGAGEDSRPGAQAVIGIALLKNGARPNHPVVSSAAGYLQRQINRSGDPAQVGFDIYSTALSIIFFITLDSDGYRPEIDRLLAYLESKQKPHGGWGYDVKKTGDTSMTQNAILALWEADKAGLPVRPDMVDRALIWLLKTQDPGGGFGYQGNPSNDFTPVRQSEIRPSMSGAGVGSIYLCADLLHVGKPPEKEGALPPALKEIKKKRPPARSRVDPRLVQQALQRGKAWMEQNFEIEHPSHKYYLYNLYTWERYNTFREIAEGTRETEPAWYDEGVRYLFSNQEADGSWKDSCGVNVATAFGILFLIRSTLISVEGERSFGDGTLVGGKGRLPKTTAGVTVVDGQVVAKPELKALDRALDALSKASSPDSSEALAALAELPSEEAGDIVSKHEKKLQELVGDKSPEARLAAVRALGKQRNLDYVPTLIYALTDPDPEIAREARDSLRRVSRNFDGFGIPDKPTELERHTGIRKWQAWYLAIRPDAEIEDY